MDVDTINGESVGNKLTPTIKSYIDAALAHPDVRVGVPAAIYHQLSKEQQARAFVDAPAHIHTELSAVMPGQTVAPAGFKPDPAHGFVKDPQALPAGATRPPAGAKPRAIPPMEESVSQGGGSIPEIGQMTHSALMQVAGHQDLPFVLMNAQLRDVDPKTGEGPSIIDGMRNPKSHVYQAWQLYKRDPAQAMDEYGLGSPAQEQYMAKNYPGTGEGRFAATMQRLPFLNALYTFGGEAVNPMAYAEGGIAGKAMGLVGGALHGSAVEQGAARAAGGVGLGSPLFDLNRRGGVEASQWAKGAISSINAPNELLHLPTNKQVLTDVFGGLGPDAQNEVVRLKQGLKPNPKFQGTPIYRTGGPGAFYSKTPDFGVGGLTAQPAENVAKSFATPRNPLRITKADMAQHLIDDGDASQMAITWLGEHGHRVPGIVSGMSAAQRDAAVMAYAKRLGYDAIETPTEFVALDKSAVSTTSLGEDLARRAKLLEQDMASVEHHQQRTGILPPERTFTPKKFFPMKNSYDLGPQAELEAELRGQGAPGGGGTTQHKVFKSLDESIASGTLDEDFLPASNYDTWRRQRLQRVAFEDAIARAPESVRRDVSAADFQNRLGVPLSQPWQRNINTSVQDTLKQWVEENQAHFQPGHPERYDLADNPKWVSAVNLMGGAKSPILERSMVAPELWSFIRDNTGLQKYVSSSGSMLPGQEQTFIGKYVGMMRNAIISNFVFHPAVNVAGNDAVARGTYNLGGPQWEVGGYAYNAAKSLATQFGLKKPESWIGTAQEYSHWLDRALVAGGTAEFGESRASALGGDYARTITVPSKRWTDRADKALTAAGDFNRDRTFGQKGEQVFAVSLFKDAVERGGLSDAKAGELVREALGDYYNFDPKSPWSSFFFFMPWLKGNMKFWINTLVKRPQYATGTAHAMRNYGLEESPESYQGPYPTGDFTTYLKGGKPFTPPFVGRDIGHVAQAVGSLAGGDILGAASTGEQMLAGRATPPTRLVADTLQTINSAFSGDVKGPETDWNTIVNPRAPHDVQQKQAASYFASHFVPIPLFTYAVQDAARKGMSGADLGQALITAGGGGYFGQAKMDDYTKRQLKKAQTNYKKAYDNYRYKDFGADYLRSEWDTYTDKLRDLGVIQ